jgi:hypothetical protein
MLLLALGASRPVEDTNVLAETYCIKLYIILREGYVVAQLVEALRYKSEGREFDSRWCNWNFSFTQSFRPHYGPGVDSASNKNEHQEYFLGR